MSELIKPWLQVGKCPKYGDMDFQIRIPDTLKELQEIIVTTNYGLSEMIQMYRYIQGQHQPAAQTKPGKE